MEIRNKNIDLLKSIGIISVITGHTIRRYPINTFINTFHMPLFFFVSGYFYKPKKIKILVNKLIKSLIVPYFILSFLLLIMDLSEGKNIIWKHELIKVLWADGYHSKSLIGSELPYVGIRWFFPALFWCRIIYNYIGQLKQAVTYSIIISISSYILGNYIINIPLGICEGGQAVIFYMSGHYFYLNKKAFKGKLNILFMILFCFLSFRFHGISMADFSYGCYPINIIGAISAIMLFYWLGEWLLKQSFFTKIQKYLLFWGINSLYILCFHILIGRYITTSNMYLQFITHIVVCALLTYLYTIIKKNKIENLN